MDTLLTNCSYSGNLISTSHTGWPTVPQCHSVNFLNERRPYFQSIDRGGKDTKCKSFAQIDLLSRSPVGVRPSLSPAIGCRRNLSPLICVIVRGEREGIINHPFRAYSAGNSLVLHHVCIEVALHSSLRMAGIPLVLIRTLHTRRFTHAKLAACASYAIDIGMGVDTGDGDTNVF